MRPFPDDVADYPPRTEIHRYLCEFAADEGIAERVRFGVEVIALEDGGAGGYLVTRRAAGGDGGAAGEPETRHYRDVICASGTLSTPYLPDIPGNFAGEHRHSSTYWGIDELRGERVLIIGAGNSGCEFACDAAQVAASASAELSMRRGYSFIAKHIFGRPSDEWTVTGPQLPARIM